MVTCKECGYLAIRNVETRALCEAEEEFRNTAELPTNFNGVVIFETTPICYRRRRARNTYGKTKTEICTKLNDEIDCDSFIDWNHGHSPREHLEMDILERQRVWQESRLADDREQAERRLTKDREYRELEAAASLARHEASLARQDRSLATAQEALENAQKQLKIRWLNVGISVVSLVASAIATSIATLVAMRWL